MSNPTDNPITRRLALMADQWLQFEEESEATLGRWLVKEEEVRMVEAFVALEETEEGNIPSLFFRLPPPFEEVNSYSFHLIENLVESCLAEENLEDLKEAGVSEVYIRGFAERKNEQAWIDFLSGFADRVDSRFNHVVAFLYPDRIEDTEGFQEWVMKVLAQDLPPRLKLMLLDWEARPLFDELEARYPKKVKTLRPELDMDSAFEELAGNSGANDPNDPGILYRKAFVALMKHSKPGQLEEAKQYFEEAHQIAKGQGWHHLDVAAYLALASAMISNTSYGEIYEIYERARIAAKEVEKEDETLGKRLSVQGWMGEGAAYISQEAYEEASEAYQAGAPLAEEIKDHILAMESWRMAGFCAEKTSIWEEAWNYNWRAIRAAQKLPEDQIGNTTLGYIGQALLHVVDKGGYAHKDRVEVLDTMDSLLGPDWQEKPLTPQAT